MSTFGNEIKQKVSKKYYCETCDYNTDRKGNYESHNLSTKHLSATIGNENQKKLSKSNNKLECEFCNKIYKDRTGLWRHNKVCKILEKNNISQTKNTESNKDELINYLIKENQEFKKLILEIIKKDTNNTNCNNTNCNNTNSNNKSFNLNLFLNETCKDAMNIMDFIDSIKLQLSDLERVGELGFVDGISNIIVKNLKDLDITKRPVHCTDKKREVLYVKDENKWEKEDNKNKKVRNAIKLIANKNIKMLSSFKDKYPDCLKSESKFSDKYNKLVIESFGGIGNEDYENENKIITKITKEVTIGKHSEIMSS
jgi:hypothetical protein